MKKPVIFLIASLAFVVAGGVLAFMVIATPKEDKPADITAVNATVTQKCTATVKKLYKTAAPLAIDTCRNAYNIEIKKNDAADDYCSNLKGNGGFSAAQLNSICGAGQRMADADRAVGTPASTGGSSGGTSGGTSTGGATSSTGSTPIATRTQSNKDPAPSTDKQVAEKIEKCKNNGGVYVNTGGLAGSDGCIGDKNQNPIYELIKLVSKFLISLLGLIFVLIVVISGFQYVISRGNPEETKAAKQRLEHAIIGIILLILMTSILNLIIPGGIL